MKIQPFETEHYYAKYEFSAPHLLSVSDCQSITLNALLNLANMSLNDLGKLELGYTETQGSLELRELISSAYSNTNADHVLMLGTPVEGLYIAMQALLDKTDEAIVLTPAYDALYNLPEHLAAKAVTWELKATQTSWELDFDALEQLITSKTKLLVVNFPHNPTGFLPTQKDFQTLIDLAKKHDLWLLCDEMYRGLEFGERPQLPSAIELYDKAIVLSGLSKTHGLPGLRAGWLIIKDQEMYKNILNWKLYTSICPSAPVEFLALAGVRAQEQLAHTNNAIIRNNLALAKPFFKKWQDVFTWRAPLAGSIALVELKQGNATTYCHNLAQQAGVVLLPTTFMRSNDSYLRFGFGRQSFQAALEHFDSFLSR